MLQNYEWSFYGCFPIHLTERLALSMTGNV